MTFALNIKPKSVNRLRERLKGSGIHSQTITFVTNRKRDVHASQVIGKSGSVETKERLRYVHRCYRAVHRGQCHSILYTQGGEPAGRHFRAVAGRPVAEMEEAEVVRTGVSCQ